MEGVVFANYFLVFAEEKTNLYLEPIQIFLIKRSPWRLLFRSLETQNWIQYLHIKLIQLFLIQEANTLELSSGRRRDVDQLHLSRI